MFKLHFLLASFCFDGRLIVFEDNTLGHVIIIQIKQDTICFPTATIKVKIFKKPGFLKIFTLENPNFSLFFTNVEVKGKAT